MRLMKQPFSCIQNIFPKIGKPGVCDTIYFYYAAQGRVDLADYKGHHPLFRQAYIPIPPLPTQRKIAAILSAYDELIENNTQRIKILEEMAQSIYCEWFVNFRFPGHENAKMVESELGLIPEPWEVASVGQIVKRVPSGKKYEEKTVSATGTVPVLDQGRSGIIGYHDNEPGVLASEDAPIIVFANHTCYQRLVMFSFSAIQNVLPFMSSLDYARNIFWLHYATKDLVTFNDYKGHWPEFMAKKLVLPPPKTSQQFGSVIEPLARLIFKLEKRNEILRSTRDLLLPRLISGELDVENLDINTGMPP
jgi:type I restriction enzyme S subunit